MVLAEGRDPLASVAGYGPITLVDCHCPSADGSAFIGATSASLMIEMGSLLNYVVPGVDSVPVMWVSVVDVGPVVVVGVP